MHSQWKVTKISKYKKDTTWVWHIDFSWRLVKYSRIILPTLPRNRNVQRNWFIQDCTQYPWQTWSSAYFLQVPCKWNETLFSLLTFSVNNSSTSWSLDIMFPYRRTGGTSNHLAMTDHKTNEISQNWRSHSMCHPPHHHSLASQWEHSVCKNQKGISTCSFYRERISTLQAMLLQTRISRFHKKYKGIWNWNFSFGVSGEAAVFKNPEFSQNRQNWLLCEIT